MIRMTKDKIIKVGNIIEENMVRLLDEGYFKSYPTKVVKGNLGKIIPTLGTNAIIINAEDLDDKDTINDMQILYLQLENYSDEIGLKLKRFLDQCGWYIADNEYHDDLESWLLHLEPKFPIENDKVDSFSKNLIEKTKVFYHISFKPYEAKILRNGLVPSFSKRKEFLHPERIYLFGEKEIAEDFIREHQTNRIAYTKSMLVRKKRNTDIDADDKYQKDIPIAESLIGFEVDLLQMMNDGKLVRLYHDNRWDNDSLVFFTQNSIPPKYLKLFK